MKSLLAIAAAWAAAWTVAAVWAPALLVVAGLGFAQNLAFTFVSRGRNSGSLAYHMVASIFSNGIWLTMFVVGVKIAAEAPTFPTAFAVVYVLSTMSGSVFAHWLARRVERGAGRNVQEDRVEKIEEKVDKILSCIRDTTEEEVGHCSLPIVGICAMKEKVAELKRRLDEYADAEWAAEVEAKVSKAEDWREPVASCAFELGEIGNRLDNAEAWIKGVDGDTGLTHRVEVLENQFGKSLKLDNTIAGAGIAVRDSLEKRIEYLEKNLPDIDAAYGKIEGLEKRVLDLEGESQHAAKSRLHIKETIDHVLEQRLDTIEARVEGQEVDLGAFVGQKMSELGFPGERLTLLEAKVQADGDELISLINAVGIHKARLDKLETAVSAPGQQGAPNTRTVNVARDMMEFESILRSKMGERDVVNVLENHKKMMEKATEVGRQSKLEEKLAEVEKLAVDTAATLSHNVQHEVDRANRLDQRLDELEAEVRRISPFPSKGEYVDAMARVLCEKIGRYLKTKRRHDGSADN